MRDEELILYQKDNGKFGVYDDTYDITIHCESQEEQDRIIEQVLNNPHHVNKAHWVSLSENGIYVHSKQCSCCHCIYDMEPKDYKYCPNCASLMEE